MPSGKCKGCGKTTNSATSNWWLTKDYIPTECYLAWDKNGQPVRGCGYEKLDPRGAMRKWVDDCIKKNPWKKTGDKKHGKQK